MMLILGFVVGFLCALLIFFLRSLRLTKSGALFFYRNKSFFELKEEIEEKLNDLLTEIRMEREALERLKLDAELLAEKLEALILKANSLVHEERLDDS